MDIWNLALNLGAAEAFSLAPQAVEAHWPGTVGDPDALLPGATAVHLLIVPYQTFAWREDEPSVNAFYPAYQNGRNIAQKLVEALQAEGIRAINAPNLPLKPLALAAGCVSMGRNCLVGAREYGTRFTLQCVLSDLEPTDAAAPAARGRLSRECARCRACLRACPTGALNGDGTIQAERCLRNFSYSEPIPEGMRPLFGVSLYGCDVCQRVCPRNAGQRAVEPPEELRRALSLKALLQGEYKPLAPFIGANYARRNRVMGRAALVAGNLRDASLLPLLQKVAESEASPAREHAAWATQRIMAGDREARPEG